jgi:hypothetical protein
VAGQNKSPAPSADARQKKSPASVGGGKSLIFTNLVNISIRAGSDGRPGQLQTIYRNRHYYNNVYVANCQEGIKNTRPLLTG